MIDLYLKRFPGSVAISARTEKELQSRASSGAHTQLVAITLAVWIPANESALIAEIHRVGHVLELQDESNDALVVAHVPPDLAQRLERYVDASQTL